MLIRIQPLDTLFFRNARSFSMGEETWAESVFPPNPSVIYGALRAFYISQHADFSDSKAVLEEATKDIRIKGIYLEEENIPYLPLPLDVVQEMNARNPNFFTLDGKKTAQFSTLTPSHFAHEIGKDFDDDTRVEEVAETCFFSKTEYSSYLTRIERGPISMTPMQHLITKEPKIGIKRDCYTRSAGGNEAGNLYRVEMLRFSKMQYDKHKQTMHPPSEEPCLLIDCEGLENVQAQVVRLGGEGKLAHFMPLTDGAPNIRQPENLGDYFKLCLAAPAIFEKGWLPRWLDENTLAGSPFTGLSLQLVGATTGKSIGVGGFDMKERKPKTLLKAVPAGAVYYFKILEGSSDLILRNFHGKSISETVMLAGNEQFDTAREGYGLVFVGNYQPL